MQDKVWAAAGPKLPLWAKLALGSAGILLAGIGMSRFLSGGPMWQVFIPIITGAIIVYLSGYDRKIYIDAGGIWRETSFWGPRNMENVAWSDVADARVILNRGKNIYVIMHGAPSLWPCAFTHEQTDEVLALLGKYLDEEDINIER